MRKHTASALLMMSAALLTAACAKHDDTANVTTGNDTVVTGETGGFNEATPDLNAAVDATTNETPANAEFGNAAAPPN